jgi:hypothetical protein
MNDDELIEELYRRFHWTAAEPGSARIKNLPVADLPFTDENGKAFGMLKHLVRGDDKSGASFDIYRLGWFAGRVWEAVVIDGAYLPHVHRKIDSEFFILAGRGHLSHDGAWDSYRERSRISIAMAVAHGFVTDPEFGPTVFLSIQTDPIRKITIDPNTKSEKFEDDFVYADDRFPIPLDLLNARNQKLASFRARSGQKD